MVTTKNGRVVGVAQVSALDDLMLVASSGKVLRMSASDIPLRTRNTIGVKLIDLADGEMLVGMAPLESTKKDLT
jgi:DNA gyrase subunit A